MASEALICCCNYIAYKEDAHVRRYHAILKHLLAMIAAAIIAQCGASLVMAVHEGWHEAAHHHDGEEDHDCPVVQLAHGFWDIPVTPIFAVPQPPLQSGITELIWTARQAPALVLTSCVLEHAPPEVG